MKRKRVFERIISVCLGVAFSVLKWKIGLSWLKSIAILIVVALLLYVLLDCFFGDDYAQDK